jgi:hypothetical protein
MSGERGMGTGIGGMLGFEGGLGVWGGGGGGWGYERMVVGLGTKKERGWVRVVSFLGVFWGFCLWVLGNDR